MSVIPTPVSNNDNGYFFALKNDPGVGQTLSLTGDTLAISGGNSVDVANATTVSTSKVKLTAQTYIAGFNTTNFTGDVRSEGRVISAPPLGLGTATLNGGLANVTITGIAGNNPSVLFEKSVDKASIVYNGADILMSTIKVSTISVNAEIYDSFGSPGSAGMQLQSSGPGLGTVWGAGSGVGLTAVIAGSNIAVDNTNPIAPIVSLAINSTINMNGFNIVNGNDILLKGTNPSVDFFNSANVQKAGLDYVESSDKITLSCTDVVAESLGAGRGHRMILDAAGAALTSQDADTTLQRSQTGLGIRTIATLEDNGVIQIGTAGIGTNPSIALVPNAGTLATIGNVAGTMSMTSDIITLSTPSVLLGGITTYNTGAGVQNTVFADVNNLDEILTNNAYVPMTNYASGIAFTINPTQTIAFDTNSMPGGQLFRWRYSGQFGPSGLGGRSRYCGALRFQVDVNIASRSWDIPDTIIWWVELNDTINGQVYQAQDFGTSGDRYGYITTSQINPTNSEICHSVSFSSIFDLDTSVTGQPTPDDGDDCYFTVYGWGNGTTTTNRANVSVSIRPMRNLL